MAEKLIHNLKQCTHCGACIPGCFRKNFQKNEKGSVDLKADYADNCILCGHCISVCPVEGALTLEGENWSDDGAPGIMPDEKQVMSLLMQRRTRRSFSKEEVAIKDLEKLIDAARYAPSGHNSQNYHFTVTNDPKKVKLIGEGVLRFYRKITSLLKRPVTRPLLYLAAGKSNYHLLMGMQKRLDNHQRIYRETGSIEMTWDAPALIIIHGPEGQDTMINCALAGYNIMLRAETMNIGTCILGLLRGGIGHASKDLEKAGINIPTDHAVYMILAAGHPDNNEKFKHVPPRRRPTVTFA